MNTNEYAIIANRIEDQRTRRVAGSVITKCVECGADVWLCPGSVKSGIKQIVCVACFEAWASENPDGYTVHGYVPKDGRIES